MTSEFFHEGLTEYRKLFWPDFIQNDGCFFLAFDEVVYRQWLQQMNGDKRRIEAVMNHRHITDLLPASIDKPTRELVVAFGQLLRELWEAKLKRDFPTKRFRVSFPLEEYESLDDYEVTFYQIVEL